MENLVSAKQELKLIDYIKGNKKRLKDNQVRVNPCPVCGHKDHFTIYTDKNSYSSFSGCCKGGSIIDYMIEVEGKEKSQAIKEVLELTGYTQNNQYKNNNVKKEFKKEEKPITQAVESKRDIDLTSNIINAYNNTTDFSYFENRKISKKIIDKYKLCVINPNDLLKDNIDLLPNLNNISDYEYILPQWEDNKIVSLIGRKNDRKSTENNKTFNLKGVNQKIFNIDLLKSDKSIIFICEAIFDALAIESVGNSCNSISLNSVSMANKFIDKVKENIENCKDKLFVLCGDNDKAGKDLDKKLNDKLKELEISTISLKIEDYKDINEFATSDYKGFVEKIKKIIVNIEFKDTVYEYINNTLMQEIERNKNYKVKKTGFNDFDYKLYGGLHSGLYVLGATSSLGKTTLVHQIADNVSKNDNNVLFFSLEQSKFELVSKTISRELTKIDIEKSLTTRQIMNGEINENLPEAIENYIEASKNLKIFEGNFNTTVSTIRKQIEEHINKHNGNPLVIVDYLQVIQSEDMRMSDKQKVENNVTELKRISRDFNIPLIVISSLNRDSYLNPISFESFKETGGIEYTADCILGLQYTDIDKINQEKTKSKQRELLKAESSNIPRNITLVCLKNRNGKQNFSCGFKFYPQYNFFKGE